MEHWLERNIEAPANAILDKLRAHTLISQQEKALLARYMVAMYKRVPAAHDRVNAMIGPTAVEIARKVDADLDNVLAHDPPKQALVEERRALAHEGIRRITADPPREVWLSTIPPEATPDVVAAIGGMTWCFLEADHGVQFLTSDNPLFHFEHIGIGQQHSEVSFPISSDILLWGSWRRDVPEGFFRVGNQVVKEMNRRTASNATRHVYAGRNEAWIPNFAAKRAHRLTFLNLRLRHG